MAWKHIVTVSKATSHWCLWSSNFMTQKMQNITWVKYFIESYFTTAKHILFDNKLNNNMYILYSFSTNPPLISTHFCWRRTQAWKVFPNPPLDISFRMFCTFMQRSPLVSNIFPLSCCLSLGKRKKVTRCQIGRIWRVREDFETNIMECCLSNLWFVRRCIVLV